MRIAQLMLVVLAISCRQAFAGYTHYFEWHEKPDEASLKKCVAEMNLLIQARKDILVAPDRREGAIPGLLKLGITNVNFNGVEENAHETFVFPARPSFIPGRPGFNFCKTEGKPCDEVVTACLIVARDHFPPSVLSISSDGSWEADWTAGAILYTSVLKRPAKNPLDSGIVSRPRLALPVLGIIAALSAVAAFYYLEKRWGKFGF